MVYIEIAFLGVLVGTLIVGTTRGARLKRLARTWNARYDKQVLALLTAAATQQLRLFNGALHQFVHVLTWRESRAFVRVCDDKMTPSSLDKHKFTLITLASAELTKGSFVPFILTPRGDDKTPPHPALPPSLATRFTLQAPANFKLSSALVALLQAGNSCYLEASVHALVYHEYKLIAPLQVAQVRWRMRQFIAELATLPVSASPSQTFFSSNPDAQAQALMELHTPCGSSGKGISSRWGYGIFWLLSIGGLLAGMHYLLHHLPGR